MNTFEIILSSPAATTILILFLGSGLALAFAITIGAWVSRIEASARRHRSRPDLAAWHAALGGAR